MTAAGELVIRVQPPAANSADTPALRVGVGNSTEAFSSLQTVSVAEMAAFISGVVAGFAVGCAR